MKKLDKTDLFFVKLDVLMSLCVSGASLFHAEITHFIWIHWLTFSRIYYILLLYFRKFELYHVLESWVGEFATLYNS